MKKIFLLSVLLLVLALPVFSQTKFHIGVDAGADNASQTTSGQGTARFQQYSYTSSFVSDSVCVKMDASDGGADVIHIACFTDNGSNQFGTLLAESGDITVTGSWGNPTEFQLAVVHSFAANEKFWIGYWVVSSTGVVRIPHYGSAITSATKTSLTGTAIGTQLNSGVTYSTTTWASEKEWMVGHSGTVGACCLPDGSCLSTDTYDCTTTRGGTYQGDGTTCGGVSCPQPPQWACCLQDGSCTSITQASCTAQLGTWHSGQTCGQVSCPQPVYGACCIPTGVCLSKTSTECSAAGGVYQGDNTTCTPTNPCPQPDLSKPAPLCNQLRIGAVVYGGGIVGSKARLAWYANRFGAMIGTGGEDGTFPEGLQNIRGRTRYLKSTNNNIWIFPYVTYNMYLVNWTMSNGGLVLNDTDYIVSEFGSSTYNSMAYHTAVGAGNAVNLHTWDVYNTPMDLVTQPSTSSQLRNVIGYRSYTSPEIRIGWNYSYPLFGNVIGRTFIKRICDSINDPIGCVDLNTIAGVFMDEEGIASDSGTTYNCQSGGGGIAHFPLCPKNWTSGSIFNNIDPVDRWWDGQGLTTFEQVEDRNKRYRYHWEKQLKTYMLSLGNKRVLPNLDAANGPIANGNFINYNTDGRVVADSVGGAAIGEAGYFNPHQDGYYNGLVQLVNEMQARKNDDILWDLWLGKILVCDSIEYQPYGNWRPRIVNLQLAYFLDLFHSGTSQYIFMTAGHSYSTYFEPLRQYSHWLDVNPNDALPDTIAYEIISLCDYTGTKGVPKVDVGWSDTAAAWIPAMGKYFGIPQDNRTATAVSDPNANGTGSGATVYVRRWDLLHPTNGDAMTHVVARYRQGSSLAANTATSFTLAMVSGGWSELNWDGTYTDGVSLSQTIKNGEARIFIRTSYKALADAGPSGGAAPAPVFSINNASAAEGSTITFTVSIPVIQPNDVTVRVSTSDGSATIADNDYSAQSNVLITIPQGYTSASFVVTTTPDNNIESDETFSVTLTSPSNSGSIGTSPGTGTVVNNDFAQSGTAPTVSGRHLNQGSTPVFYNGDTGWSLFGQLTYAQAVQYLTDRASRGINIILVNCPEPYYADHAPNDINNVSPFTGTFFASSINNAYWSNVDAVLTAANNLGITILMDVCYVGWGCNNTAGTGPSGFCDELKVGSVTTTTMGAYGTELGNRYKNFPNIIWLLGGDSDPGNVTGLTAKLNALATALKAADNVYTGRVWTCHGSSGTNPQSLQFGNWVTLDGIYTWDDQTIPTLTAGALANSAKPFLGIEFNYENGFMEKSLVEIRAQAYRAILGGACGHVFGNSPMWYFTSAPGVAEPNGNSGNPLANYNTPWQNMLNSTGINQMTYFGQLFNSRKWYNLTPNNALVTSVTPGGTVYSAAGTTDNSSIICYTPVGGSLTVNPSSLSGTGTKAYWFNPTLGGFTYIGPFDKSTRAFSTPGSGSTDWVLVIDGYTSTTKPPATVKRAGQKRK